MPLEKKIATSLGNIEVKADGVLGTIGSVASADFDDPGSVIGLAGTMASLIPGGAVLGPVAGLLGGLFGGSKKSALSGIAAGIGKVQSQVAALASTVVKGFNTLLSGQQRVINELLTKMDAMNIEEQQAMNFVLEAVQKIRAVGNADVLAIGHATISSVDKIINTAYLSSIQDLEITLNQLDVEYGAVKKAALGQVGNKIKNIMGAAVLGAKKELALIAEIRELQKEIDIIENLSAKAYAINAIAEFWRIKSGGFSGIAELEALRDQKLAERDHKGELFLNIYLPELIRLFKISLREQGYQI